MFLCRCGVCQQVIAWEDGKRLITNEYISCPSCQSILALNDKARSIALTLEVLLFLMILYFSLGSYQITVFFIALGGLLWEEVIKIVRGLAYVISMLFSLQLKIRIPT